jgi:hypothetical protein
VTAFNHTGTMAAAIAPARKRPRTILALLAAIAVLSGVAAGSIDSQADRTQVSPARQIELGARPASRIVPCTMPPAWRKACPVGDP